MAMQMIFSRDRSVDLNDATLVGIPLAEVKSPAISVAMVRSELPRLF